MHSKQRLADHINKAEGYLMLGMAEDALHEVEQALHIDVDSYAANYLRGIALIAQERYTDAAAPLKHAISVEPDRPEAYIHLAYVHRRTVSLDKAIETISRAVELKPDMALGNYNIACYYALKGDPEEALRYLRRAINIDGDLRQIARLDEDFDSLHINNDFRRLAEMQ